MVVVIVWWCFCDGVIRLDKLCQEIFICCCSSYIADRPFGYESCALPE